MDFIVVAGIIIFSLVVYFGNNNLEKESNAINDRIKNLGKEVDELADDYFKDLEYKSEKKRNGNDNTN
jgi:hypothetical protein